MKKTLLMLASAIVVSAFLCSCKGEEEVGFGGEVKQAPASATQGAKKGGAASMPTVDPNR